VAEKARKGNHQGHFHDLSHKRYFSVALPSASLKIVLLNTLSHDLLITTNKHDVSYGII
jgi:hypothetical protein